MTFVRLLAQLPLPHDIEEFATYQDSFGNMVKDALIWSLGGIFLVALSWIIWARYRKRKSQVVKPEGPSLATDPVAYLQMLMPPSGDNVSSKELTDYWALMSEAWRKFLSLRFGVAAESMLIKDLELVIREKIPGSLSRNDEMMAFFRRVEAIQFAGAATSVRETQDMHQALVNWAKSLRVDRYGGSWQ